MQCSKWTDPNCGKILHCAASRDCWGRFAGWHTGLIRNCWCACGYMSISISWIISIEVKMMMLFHYADCRRCWAEVHCCTMGQDKVVISTVKKYHHLDFDGNNSWNGNAHVTTGTSTIPYEASVLYKILWGQPANRPQQPLEATQWTILPQFGSFHLLYVLTFSKSFLPPSPTHTFLWN